MTIYFLSLFLFISTLDRVLLEFQDINLVVTDSKSEEENPSHLLRFINESLELICQPKNVTEYKKIWLNWSYDKSSFDAIDEDYDNETSIEEPYELVRENGTLKLFISHLQLIHNGRYKCEGRTKDPVIYSQNVTLIVKSKQTSCEKKFNCDDGNQCISSIYKCDGVIDCKTKIDESPELCGLNPCEGRITCPNGRCIPKEWCKPCDPHKMNCTNIVYIHHCCPNHLINYLSKGFFYGDGSYPGRINEYNERLNMQQHYDINFIQTTIYTIIGCALVFMIIGTVLVVAICRIHMKRSLPSHVPNNRRTFTTTAYHRAFTQEIGVYDLDMPMNRSEGPGLLVTYNINNGVQIVGSPVEPPPYSEVAALPPPEGPPPPYTLSNMYDNSSNLRNVRSVQCETSPKSNDHRRLRHGLSNARVSSEPSLLNVNRL